MKVSSDGEIRQDIFDYINENPDALPSGMYFAIDFDGTIVQFDEWKGSGHFGSVRDNAKRAIELIKDNGNYVIIHTCRRNLDKVEEFLNDNNIPFDFINENPYAPDGAGKEKIFAHFYIDNRAIQCTNWRYVMWELITGDEHK